MGNGSEGNLYLRRGVGDAAVGSTCEAGRRRKSAKSGLLTPSPIAVAQPRRQNAGDDGESVPITIEPTSVSFNSKQSLEWYWKQ
jgi:hypothetical protein